MLTLNERLRAMWSSGAVWALADQATVSLGSFLTSVLLARVLEPESYGVYVLFLSMIFLLNAVHGGLIISPLTILGAQVDRLQLRRLTGVSAALTLLLAPLPVGILLGMALCLHRLDLLAAVLAAFFCWQLQELFRRALMASLRFRAVILGDAVSFLGQALCLYLIAHYGSLNLRVTFVVVAITSLIAALVQAIQAGASTVSMADLREGAREFWRLGRWILLSNGVNVLVGQSIPWALAAFHGPSATGRFQLVVNAMAATNPILLGLSNLLLPMISKARAESGARGAYRLLLGRGGAGFLLLAPYYLLLLAFPGWILHLLYGQSVLYPGLETALRVMVVSFALGYVGQMITVLLAGLGRSDNDTAVQGMGLLSSLVLGAPLCFAWGVAGAALGSAAVNSGRVLSGLFAARNVMGQVDTGCTDRTHLER